MRINDLVWFSCSVALDMLQYNLWLTPVLLAQNLWLNSKHIFASPYSSICCINAQLKRCLCTGIYWLSACTSVFIYWTPRAILHSCFCLCSVSWVQPQNCKKKHSPLFFCLSKTCLPAQEPDRLLCPPNGQNSPDESSFQEKPAFGQNHSIKHKQHNIYSIHEHVCLKNVKECRVVTLQEDTDVPTTIAPSCRELQHSCCFIPTGMNLGMGRPI